MVMQPEQTSGQAGSVLTTQVGGQTAAQTPEDLLSIRNLVDAELGPLRRFIGTLDSYPYSPETYGNRTVYRCTLNFRELDVKEATEPYLLPVYSLPPISMSNRKKSRWGMLGTSLAEVLDKQYSEAQLDPNSPEFLHPKNRMNIKECLNRRLGMVLSDGQEGRPEPPMLYDGRAEADMPTPCWMVYLVEGIGTTEAGIASGKEVAMSLLDNSTLDSFNTQALANPTIRGDGALLASISMPPGAPNNFVNTMLQSGQFTKDEQNIYHKVEK